MKIVSLANPVGLMLRVPDSKFEQGVKELIKKARKDSIAPSAITFTNELDEELVWEILLFGDK